MHFVHRLNCTHLCRLSTHWFVMFVIVRPGLHFNLGRNKMSASFQIAETKLKGTHYAVLPTSGGM